jgi:hypothetical protein
LRTFRIFQQKLETLGRHAPGQSGLCRPPARRHQPRGDLRALAVTPRSVCARHDIRVYVVVIV